MNKPNTIKLALLGLVVSLTGCQTLMSETPPSDGAEPQPLFEIRRPAQFRADAEVSRLLSYHSVLLAKSDAELAREITRLRGEITDNDCRNEHFQLALAELARGGSLTAGVLNGCLAEEQPPLSLKRFAQLIQKQLDERRERQTYAAAMQERLEQQKQENLELRRQLDGLRAIERSLQGRDRPLPPGS